MTNTINTINALVALNRKDREDDKVFKSIVGTRFMAYSVSAEGQKRIKEKYGNPVAKYLKEVPGSSTKNLVTYGTYLDRYDKLVPGKQYTLARCVLLDFYKNVEACCKAYSTNEAAKKYIDVIFSDFANNEEKPCKQEKKEKSSEAIKLDSTDVSKAKKILDNIDSDLEGQRKLIQDLEKKLAAANATLADMESSRKAAEKAYEKAKKSAEKKSEAKKDSGTKSKAKTEKATDASKKLSDSDRLDKLEEMMTMMFEYMTKEVK